MSKQDKKFLGESFAVTSR